MTELNIITAFLTSLILLIILQPLATKFPSLSNIVIVLLIHKNL